MGKCSAFDKIEIYTWICYYHSCPETSTAMCKKETKKSIDRYKEIFVGVVFVVISHPSVLSLVLALAFITIHTHTHKSNLYY